MNVIKNAEFGGERPLFESHNLEVPGSSPGWSTLRIKHLQIFCRCFFFYW